METRLEAEETRRRSGYDTIIVIVISMIIIVIIIIIYIIIITIIIIAVHQIDLTLPMVDFLRVVTSAEVVEQLQGNTLEIFSGSSTRCG